MLTLKNVYRTSEASTPSIKTCLSGIIWNTFRSFLFFLTITCNYECVYYDLYDIWPRLLVHSDFDRKNNYQLGNVFRAICSQSAVSNCQCFKIYLIIKGLTSVYGIDQLVPMDTYMTKNHMGWNFAHNSFSQ